MGDITTIKEQSVSHWTSLRTFLQPQCKNIKQWQNKNEVFITERFTATAQLKTDSFIEIESPWVKNHHTANCYVSCVILQIIILLSVSYFVLDIHMCSFYQIHMLSCITDVEMLTEWWTLPWHWTKPKKPIKMNWKRLKLSIELKMTLLTESVCTLTALTFSHNGYVYA